MLASWSRRQFVLRSPALATLGLVPPIDASLSQTPAATAEEAPEWWPYQDPAVVKEMVTVAHGDAVRVRELVERQPALANAAVDWGFGDWEDALGAAAHTGRRAIAELLLAHGARISIFGAAMLGQLDVVKAFVAARPGVQRTLGPHGITLMAHARAGGTDAAPVAAYLASLGDADQRPASAPLEGVERDAVVGRYVFGAGPRDLFEVDVQKDQLGIVRPGATRRLLIHTGQLVFFPSGAPSVRVAFARAGGQATQLTVADPDVFVTARRLP